MEYCDVGSVHDIITSTGKRLSEQLIRIVLKQVLQGLVYLHSKGIIHGNISAGHILVDHRGHCKIADFGVPRDNPSALFESFDDYKADIASLGSTAIEMVKMSVVGGDFSRFFSSCIGPSAQALSQHPWIRDADDIRVLSKWVRNKLPLLEEHRRRINENEL